MDAEEYLESMEAGGDANISLREIIVELFYHCDACSWRDYEIAFVTGQSIAAVKAELEAMEKTGEAVRTDEVEEEEDGLYLCPECMSKLLADEEEEVLLCEECGEALVYKEGKILCSKCGIEHYPPGEKLTSKIVEEMIEEARIEIKEGKEKEKEK